MVLITTFMMNLLCAVVSCDPGFDPPNVLTPVGNRNVRSSTIGNGTIIDSFSPIVNTSSGAVEGYLMSTVNGKRVYAFEGIPYAEAPTGFYRFRAPQPKKSWSGVRPAKHPGPICLQMHLVKLARVVGHEDCLRLNFYVPATTKSKLPVIIFIHGGSFFFGAGSEYGPSYLLAANKNVILVTLNYRLGVLGFLSTGDEESPGNYGLKDQVLAIRWIHENIERFGGDPKRVTLMGQSAGGVSTHLHMMTNHTKGIFQQAVSLSSSAFVPWAIFTRHQARKWADKFASKLGCPISDSKSLMDCVRGRNPNFIVANQINLFDMLIFPPVLLRPAVEPDIPGAFIVEMPEKLYEKGQVAKIPWWATSTTEEAEFVIIYLQGLGVLSSLKSHWFVAAPTVFNYGRIAKNTTEITEKLINFYLNGSDPTKASSKVFSDIGSDRYFTLGNRRAIRHHSKVAPTYSYIFGFRSTIGLAAAWGNNHNEFGVPHGEDLSYMFNSTLYWKSLAMTDPGFAISKLLVNLLTNFATHGVPFYTDEKGKDVQIWDRITNGQNPKFLQINEEVKMISDPFEDRVRFWEKLGLDDTVPYARA